MTKRDLVVKIAADTNLIQSDVANVVQKTLDYIAAVNGQEIAGVDDFKSALYASSVGDTMTLSILRKSQTSSGSMQGGGYTQVEAEIPVVQYEPAAYAAAG